MRREGPIGIIGMGGLGLMALAIAKGSGIAPVAAMDIDPGKLALARESYGADFVFDSRAAGCRGKASGADGWVDRRSGFRRLTADVRLWRCRCFVSAATYVNVGSSAARWQVPLAVLVQRQLVLRGSYVGTPDELRELAALVRGGKIKPIPIRNEPIETVNDGLGQLRAGKVTGRIVHVHRGLR